MKKALVILLSLLVVGGVFADGPTVTWGGNFEGGIGILNRGTDDDMIFGLAGPGNWVNGVRAHLAVNYDNADRNAGFRARLRATGLTGDMMSNLQFHQAWGFVRPWGSLVEFRGGHLRECGVFNNAAGFDNVNFVDPFNGLLAHINVEVVRIGFGLYSNVATPGGTWDDGALGVWGGLRFDLPGLQIRAALRHMQDVNTDATAHLGVRVIPALPILVDLRVLNLHEFDTIGRFDAAANIGLGGLLAVDGLALNLGALFSMSQNDAHADPFMSMGGWLSYVIGSVVPTVNVWFVSGGDYNYGQGFAAHTPARWGRATFNGNQSYLNIRPAIEVRAGGATWETGVVLNVELGDVGAAGGNSNDSVSFGVFTAMRVAF